MTYNDLQTEARDLVKASDASYDDTQLNSSLNRALERAVALIRDSDGRWQWDDTNSTDLPFATTGINANQGDYTLDPTHYEIDRVEIKQLGGSFYKLQPFDVNDPVCQSYTNLTTNTGAPLYYDKVGMSLILTPAPNYTQASSLTVYYRRGPSYFTTADTTKSPGINPLFHRVLSLWAAYDYAFINQLANKNDLRQEIIIIEKQMQDFYAHRDKDDKPQLTTVNRRSHWR